MMSRPVIADIRKFIEVFEYLDSFEAHQRFMNDDADSGHEDPAIGRVINWLRGIVCENTEVDSKDTEVGSR